MCDDHVPADRHPVDPLPAPPRSAFAARERAAGLSRATFLRGSGLLAGGLVLPGTWWKGMAYAADGVPLLPVTHAMHIHTSYSEQDGSLETHLDQAQKNAVDVLWLTDHDRRMEQVRYRSVVHFTDPTTERTDGGPWSWLPVRTGVLSLGATSAFVASPASPNDPVAAGSLHLAAQSADGRAACSGFRSESHPAGWNERGNLFGQTHTFDVMVRTLGPDAYLEYRVATSYHPATGGRPAGQYALSYRIGGPGLPGTFVTNGLEGVVYLPLPTTLGEFSSQAVTPAADVAVLWPDMDATDFGFGQISICGISLGGPLDAYVDYLRFDRQHNSGDLPLKRQQASMAAYGPRFPGVVQYQGIEVSGYDSVHANWIGPGVVLPDYTGVTTASYPTFVRGVVGTIHAAGALASLNHPFGSSGGAAASLAVQNQRLPQVAAALLANNAYDCDLMEVGYRARGGADLAHHVGLWDVLSQNGRFVTGTGVSDDHNGHDWLNFGMNWYTSTWAASRSMPDLLQAFSAGRAWCASLSRFRGTLDLVLDAACPMGSVSTSTAPTRRLRVLATDLPAGSRVQVVRGTVTYAGTTPNASVLATYTATQLASGSVVGTVDTTTSRFFRLQVIDSHGAVIALSNPVWALRETPARGIPAARAA